jgi:hypothetical protein
MTNRECGDTMKRDDDLVWLIERSYEAYLTWIVLWLASAIGMVTILVSVISIEFTLSLNHLVLIWILYWGLLSGMIFSAYRLVNTTRDQVSWTIQIKKGRPVREEAIDKKKRGTFSKFLVHIIKNEKTKEETAEICECRRISIYLFHVTIAGLFFCLAVNALLSVIVVASLVFISASLLLSSLGSRIVEKTKKIIKK